MATLHIGGLCAFSGCNQVDFLPVACNLCHSNFCRDHALSEDHQCSRMTRDQSQLSFSPTTRRERCALEECENPSMRSAIKDNEAAASTLCKECGKAFCISHRHPEHHFCDSSIIVATAQFKNPKAHALLEKHFGTHSTSTQRSSPAAGIDKPIKNKQIFLMKLRQKAVAADPKDERVQYNPQDCLLVRLRNSGTTAEQAFWFKKTVGTGRALDLLAAKMAMRREDDKLVHLCKIVDGGSIALKNEELLATQLDDGDRVELLLRN